METKNQLKIAIISACGVDDRYLIEAIRARFQDVLILQPFFYAGGNPNKKTALSPTFSQKVHTHFTNVRLRIVGRYLRYHLFTKKQRKFPEIKSVLKIPVWEINSQKTKDVLKEFSPDILISSDAPILKSEIISTAKKAAINLHYGIAPQYKGNHTLFWSLALKDYDHVGMTLHHLSPRLDEGKMIARIYPELSPRDHEYSVMVRGLTKSVEVLMEFLEKIANGGVVEGKQQPETKESKMFYSKQRNLRADLMYLASVVLRQNRPTRKDSRVERYF